MARKKKFNPNRKPARPRKPTSPLKRIPAATGGTEIWRSLLYNYGTIVVDDDFREAIANGSTLCMVDVDYDYAYYDEQRDIESVTLAVKADVEIDNPNYDKQMERYVEDLADYKVKFAKYKEDLAEWNELKKEYENKLIEEQREREMAELARLKAKYENE